MADKEKFNQIIEELKAIRAEKKISLDEISQKTRIRLPYLEYLENGELEKLPAVYDRFIFKSYLAELHVDEPEKYLKIFDEVRAAGQKNTTVFKTTKKQVAKIENKEFLSKAQLVKILYAGVPIIVIILIIVLVRDNSTTSTQSRPVKELTAREIVKEAKSSEENQTKTVKKEQPATSLKILLKAKDKSWIRYVKDHKDTADFILNKNNHIIIEADSVVEFKIGNPYVLSLQIDTLNYGPLAKQGEVISYMKVKKNGIVVKHVVKPKHKKEE